MLKSWQKLKNAVSKDQDSSDRQNTKRTNETNDNTGGSFAHQVLQRASQSLEISPRVERRIGADAEHIEGSFALEVLQRALNASRAGPSPRESDAILHKVRTNSLSRSDSSSASLYVNRDRSPTNFREDSSPHQLSSNDPRGELSLAHNRSSSADQAPRRRSGILKHTLRDSHSLNEAAKHDAIAQREDDLSHKHTLSVIMEKLKGQTLEFLKEIDDHINLKLLSVSSPKRSSSWTERSEARRRVETKDRSRPPVAYTTRYGETRSSSRHSDSRRSDPVNHSSHERLELQRSASTPGNRATSISRPVTPATNADRHKSFDESDRFSVLHRRRSRGSLYSETPSIP